MPERCYQLQKCTYWRGVSIGEVSVLDNRQVFCIGEVSILKNCASESCMIVLECSSLRRGIIGIPLCPSGSLPLNCFI